MNKTETLTTSEPHAAIAGQVVQMSCDDGAFWRITEVTGPTSMRLRRLGFWQQVRWWIVTRWDLFWEWARR
jgi:hypothetical protein